jgi:type II secretory pathway pseudopilin PulG
MGARRQRCRGRSGDIPPTGRRDEGGFILLESVISITLLTIILAALTTFYVTATDSTSSERTRQSAILVADTEMDLLRGIQAADLPLGRSSALAAAQFAAAPTSVSSWLSTMDPATDTTTVNLTSPMSAVTTIAGTAYTTTNYLGWCSLLPIGSVPTSCTNTATAKLTGTPYLRAVVAVTWNARGCPSGSCAFVDATLISTAADPVFTLGQLPPSAPIVTNPGDQTSAVNDDVGLQMSVAASTGVAPLTWQIAGLPTGLSMSIGGLISGKPTSTTTSQLVTVTVTDAFLRTATVTFHWTVVPALIPNTPGTQTSNLNTAINPLTFTATGGSGSPYTWTDPAATLPAGLTISSAGVVTGTPTTLGTSTVTLTVADSSGRKRTITFTWKVTVNPLSASIPNQSNQVLRPIGTVTFTAVGGSGNYSWTDPTASLPPGLSMSTSGVVTGTPTVLGSYTVKVLVTDVQLGTTANATFIWSVVRPSSITGGTTPFTTTTGATITSQPLTYSCPTSSCTYTLSGAPLGIGLGTTSGNTGSSSVTVLNTSGTIYLGGTISGSAGAYVVTITPVDNVSTATGTVTTAAWTVRSRPTSSAPAVIKTSVGATIVDQPLTYTCPSANCTYTFTSGPTGIGLDADQTGSPQSSVTVSATSGTIYVRGTIAASTPLGAATVSVTAADNTTNAPVTTASSTWTLVAAMQITATSIAATGNSSQSAPSAYTCAYSTCTITVSGQPLGIGIGATSQNGPNGSSSVSVVAGSGTVYVSGKVSSSNPTGTYPVVVTIADAAGSTVKATATWVVS